MRNCLKEIKWKFLANLALFQTSRFDDEDDHNFKINSSISKEIREWAVSMQAKNISWEYFQLQNDSSFRTDAWTRKISTF